MEKNYEYFKDSLDVTHLRNTTYQEVSDFAEAILKSKDTMFFIVANESTDKIKPLVEKWIASIPTEVSYPMHNEKLLFPIDTVEKTIPRIDSKDVVYVIHASILKKDINETMDSKYAILNLVAEKYMQNRAHERIREELGNAYFVSVEPHVRFKPFPSMFVTVFFPAPKNKGKETLEELKTVLADLVPVDEKELETAKNLVRSGGKELFHTRKLHIDIDLKMIKDYVIKGVEMYTQEEKDKLFAQIESITADEMNTYITELLSGSIVSIITVPSVPTATQEDL